MVLAPPGHSHFQELHLGGWWFGGICPQGAGWAHSHCPEAGQGGGGGCRSGKGWSQALCVCVPNTAQQLRIGSQEQQPDNDPLQTRLELISSAPPMPPQKLSAPLFLQGKVTEHWKAPQL
uniref:Uncharacterized protein n=1 Tax=Mustela putorius furo TaxID=9669 RepID=M3YMW5_MUSPF